MARPNERVAAVLQEYADLLAITGGDAFKARAYEKAARSIGGHHADVSGMGAKQLRSIPGVGRSIAEKVAEYFATGTIPSVEEARERIPAGVRELVAVPTLGPKRALTLYQDLGVSSVRQLADALHAGRLDDVRGFGPRTRENLLRGIALLRASGDQAADRRGARGRRGGGRRAVGGAGVRGVRLGRLAAPDAGDRRRRGRPGGGRGLGAVHGRVHRTADGR